MRGEHEKGRFSSGVFFCKLASKQASIFICHSVLAHNNAKMYIKQADRLPERPKAINAGCPKLTDNTM